MNLKNLVFGRESSQNGEKPISKMILVTFILFRGATVLQAATVIKPRQMDIKWITFCPVMALKLNWISVSSDQSRNKKKEKGLKNLSLISRFTASETHFKPTSL